MIHETFNSGVLRERRDDTSRTVTTYDETGTLIETRPYTPEENVAADAAAQARADAEAAQADRKAVRALVDGINASIDEAKAAKVAAQAVLDAVAPTTVPQVWARVKDLTRAVRDTDNALIGAEQGVKALAKYVRDQ